MNQEIQQIRLKDVNYIPVTHSDQLNLLHILEKIIIVNQEIRQIRLKEVNYILATHSGMAISVKVPAALVPSLPHGSVYSFLL